MSGSRTAAPSTKTSVPAAESAKRPIPSLGSIAMFSATGTAAPVTASRERSNGAEKSAEPAQEDAGARLRSGRSVAPSITVFRFPRRGVEHDDVRPLDVGEVLSQALRAQNSASSGKDLRIEERVLSARVVRTASGVEDASGLRDR